MKTEFQNSIILKLKILREKHGLSQAATAKLLGISTGQLGNIESYKHPHKYTIKQISILCKELDISIVELFLLANLNTEIKNVTDELVEQIIKYQEK